MLRRHGREQQDVAASAGQDKDVSIKRAGRMPTASESGRPLGTCPKQYIKNCPSEQSERVSIRGANKRAGTMPNASELCFKAKQYYEATLSLVRNADCSNT